MSRKLKKFVFLFLVALLVMPPGWIFTPVAQAVTKMETVYHEIFDDGLGVAKEAGNAKLEALSDFVFEGNEDGKAVHVSERTNNWDGIDIAFSDVGMEDGKTYTITVTGYVDEDVSIPEGAQAYLQNASNFDWIASADYVAGEAFTLTGEYIVETGEDAALRIQSNDDGKTVPFYIGDILITTEVTSNEDEEEEESTEDNGNEQNPEIEAVYHETFSDGLGIATQAGSAQLEAVSDVDFEGNEDGYAVYVSGRTNNWDGVDIRFSDVGMENGNTYTVTVTGYVDEEVNVPEGAQALLQNVASYSGLYVNADFNPGEAFTLTGQYTVNTSNDSALRIQSNGEGETVPFYIGDILITEDETSGGDEENGNEEEETPEVEAVYHETFSDGLGVVTQSGNAQLEAVSDVVFEGNEDGHAVYVGGRSNNWDGIEVVFGDVGMENGNTYTITVTGYVDEEESVPAGAQALLQNVDSYDGLYANGDLVAGEAFTLTGEYTVDTTRDRALRIQSNDEGATVPFYIGDILIIENETDGEDDEDEEQEEPRPPAEEFTTIDFEDGTTGGFEGRAGTETLTVTDEANHTDGGSYSLKVEDRANTWHGPTLNVAKYVDEGAEYAISAWVKLISPATSQLQLSTQVGQGDGASYNNIQGKTVSAEDGWVKLEGTYRYSSVGNEFLTIYVESSNNSTASFYIDDISFEPTDSAPIEIEKDLIPIKDVYEDYFLIGNAVSSTDLEGTRRELLTMHHNLATAENAMKPGYAYNDEREFDFTAEDELVETALAAGLKMHGHVLVWHQQSAEWLHTDENGQSLGREEALGNLRTHVKTTVEHFGEDVISWDVVNEAMIDNPPNPADWKASLRQSGWYRAIGPDYVEQSFLAAREVLDENGWDIKLYYNDYNDDNQQKAEAIYQMVKEINENYAAENDGELLIDGIGMQGHYNLNTNPENVRRSLEKFISLGVEVGVTELDVTAGSNNVLTEQEANAQGYLYAQLFSLYKEHAEHISRVTFWGLNDATSWRAAQSPLLFDRNMQAKPAYYAVIDPETFIDEHEVDERDANRENALFGTPVIDGTVDDVWSDAPELPINRYQMAWQGADGVARVLWDHENLYVLIEVSDSELDKSSSNPWEQDSIEVFVDENNAKTSFYEDGDGQYRVNFDNETSFNPESIAEGFESATHVSGSGYTVEVKIPFKTVTPENDMDIGFDVQINDAQDGARQSAAAWNDTTGVGYQDTSVFGVLTLVEELENGEPGPGEPGPGEPGPGEPGPGEPGPGEPGPGEPGPGEPGPGEPGPGEPGPGEPGPGEPGPGEPGPGEPGPGEPGPGEPGPGEPGPGDTDPEGPGSGDTTGEEEKEPVKGDKDSEKLPDTATNLYTKLLVGMLLVIGGFMAYFIARRRAAI